MSSAVIPTPATNEEAPVGAPRRQTLVGLAAVILVGYGALLATGSDIAYDAPLRDFTGAYDQSERAIQLTSYAGMAFVALLLFFGAALRNAVRGSARTWYADVTLLGFAGLGATIAAWSVTDLAMWKAVHVGDASAVRTLAAVSDASFLPLMAAMAAAYVGTGLAGLRTATLPTWLAIASIGVGVVAPVGPLGFVGTLLLPLWILAVALTVRLDPRARSGAQERVGQS